MDSTDLNKTGMKILIVDDTSANIDVLRLSLEAEGYNLAFAPNGKVALKLVANNKPDLILLDIMMPEMDGLETCKQLKSSDETKEIPVIFITAKIETGDIIKGFQIGGADYIGKPFRHEEVCSRVKTHLQLVASQKQLKKKNHSLVDLNNLKNAFIGMAAHDLRNPLTIICGLTDLIMMSQKYDLPKKIKEDIMIINDTGKDMLAVINNLLDITAIESGKLKVELMPGKLKPLIEKQLKRFTISSKNKEIEIHTSLSDIDNILFDHDYIKQIIDNLISNALKFSEFNKNIFITLKMQGEEALFSVRDEGPGISEEDQKMLFKPFQKLNARPTGGERSTGLGLTIVKKLIEDHNGRFSVESQLGVGSKFSFTLPLQP